MNADEYLDEQELSKYLGVSTRTIQRWRVSGEGPPWIRMGARAIRYSVKSCKAWAEQRTYKHYAQELNASK